MTTQKSVPPAAPQAAPEQYQCDDYFCRPCTCTPPAAPQPATENRWREAYEKLRDYCYSQGWDVSMRHLTEPQTPAEPVAWIDRDDLAALQVQQDNHDSDQLFYPPVSRWKCAPGDVPLYLAPHSAGPAAGSVAPTVSGSGESSSPSVGSSVAEPTESAIIFGFESASDFEDSRLYKLLSGCRGAALHARITWRAMNEERRVEVDEWWRMLTGEDWESLGEIPDDDDESSAEYQARIAATEARTLGTGR